MADGAGRLSTGALDTEQEEIEMGEVLAAAAGRVYQETLEASDIWQRAQAGDGAVEVDVLALLGMHARPVRAAIVFLAQQMEDPDLMGEALLASLQAFIATEPAE